MARYRNYRIPLWLNILLITLGVIVAVGAVYCLVAGLTAAWNGTGFADECANIWFAIFPSLKTAETVTEEVVETASAII